MINVDLILSFASPPLGERQLTQGYGGARGVTTRMCIWAQ